MARPVVLLMATMDTKGAEARFVADCLEEAGVDVWIMDAGIMGVSPFPVQTTREEVARAGGSTLQDVQSIGHEGKALNVMTRGAECIAGDLYRQGRIQGLIGIGGSMGTTLGASVMRTFPLGVPKVMVSTMASRNTHAFVGAKDIMMLHSVCDLAGLNRLTKTVLRNGALAAAAMAAAPPAEFAAPDRPAIALSTLGTTETCARDIRRMCHERGREVVTFHTVGAGGMAMEDMVRNGDVAAVVDLSLQELISHRFGGDYDAGPDRGRGAGRAGIPTVLVPGNIDFLVTGPVDKARRRFPNRPYHIHNSAITVVRTNRDEIAAMGRFVAHLANTAQGPVAVLVPLGGFSAFDHPSADLHDPEGPRVFSDVVKAELRNDVPLQLAPVHINDPAFSAMIVAALEALELNRS